MHDVLHEGWGALIEWAGRQELVVSTFTESELTNAQVWREILAGPSQLTDIIAADSSGWSTAGGFSCLGQGELCFKASAGHRRADCSAVREASHGELLLARLCGDSGGTTVGRVPWGGVAGGLLD